MCNSWRGSLRLTQQKEWGSDDAVENGWDEVLPRLRASSNSHILLVGL